ncbi:MAG: substrate-binding domain-containing protein [Betaproteobacteria bacterium]|nr:substrate-binding domain-containing protein [Betaproteobacteria bacterium]
MPSNLARAREVRVLSPSAMHSSLEPIAKAHRQQTQVEVRLTFETAPRLAQRLAGGEAADVVVAPPGVMDELVRSGKVNAEGRFQLGRVGVGIAVRTGAPVPEVSSSEALKRTLLAADAVIYNRASSGLYVTRLLERLGVAGAIQEKSAVYDDAVASFTRLLSGQGREIGFGGLPEIKRWHDRGLRLVAPLPEDIQNYTAYVAALGQNPPNPHGARAFLRFLAGPVARAIFAANGVE